MSDSTYLPFRGVMLIGLYTLASTSLSRSLGDASIHKCESFAVLALYRITILSSPCSLSGDVAEYANANSVPGLVWVGPN